MAAITIHNPRIAGKYKSRSMWQRAIDYLEAELERTKKDERIGQIRCAIETFRANLKRGVRWPRSRQHSV